MEEHVLFVSSPRSVVYFTFTTWKGDLGNLAKVLQESKDPAALNITACLRAYKKPRNYLHVSFRMGKFGFTRGKEGGITIFHFVCLL